MAFMLSGQGSGDARPTVCCLPYAGGGRSIYRGWAEGLAGIDVHAVELPGRDSRFGEPAFTRVEPLARWLLDVLGGCDRAGVALFGHSMGAVVAFELARRLPAVGMECLHLFVSGCAAPHTGQLDDGTHRLSDQGFLDRIKQLGGTPPELFEDGELLALFLPVLRADYELTGTYRYGGHTVTCPVTALAGSEDSGVSPTAVSEWRRLTTGPFQLELFPGGHFFLRAEKERVLALIARQLGVSAE